MSGGDGMTDTTESPHGGLTVDQVLDLVEHHYRAERERVTSACGQPPRMTGIEGLRAHLLLRGAHSVAVAGVVRWARNDGRDPVDAVMTVCDLPAADRSIARGLVAQHDVEARP